MSENIQHPVGSDPNPMPTSQTPITIGVKDLPAPSGGTTESGPSYTLAILGGVGKKVDLVWCGASLGVEDDGTRVHGRFKVLSLDEYEWSQYFSAPAEPQLEVTLMSQETVLETVVTTGKQYPDCPLFALVVQDSNTGTCLAAVTFSPGS